MNALGEELLGGADSLVNIIWQGNFYYVSCLGSQIGEGVGWVDYAAGVYSFNLVGENFVELNFFLNEIAGPCSDAVVVDREAF